MTGSRGADTIAARLRNQGSVLSDGILLVNLGSPDSPSVPDVRRYLGEFLMDRHVLDVPTPIRWLIVNLAILPTRPKRSAHAYAQIWEPADANGFGSPLLQHSVRLRDAVRAQMDVPVALAMRYGNPAIAAGLDELRAAGATRVLIAPLYPQHADSTTTTVLEAAGRHAGDLELQTLPPFYAHPAYIDALAETTRAHLPERFDHLLMSYHGLPERHLTSADPTGNHCLRAADCCERASAAHATCYRHQGRVTSRLLAQALGLTPTQWSISYQSRLGRLPWLTPYTDATLRELPARGVRHLAVVCPAFVADNLETLEEIGITGRATFLDAGGESFTAVPCMNADAAWAAALTRLCTEALRR